MGGKSMRKLRQEVRGLRRWKIEKWADRENGEVGG